MSFKLKCILLLIFVGFTEAKSQTKEIDSLLKTICSFQQANSSFYNHGLFPSQRVYLKQKNYIREDNNVFFTGLIVWTLQTYESRLSLINHKLIDSVSKEATKNYSLYKNKNGGVTYNFWQTNPSQHFPNDSYFSKRKKYQLPDDLDDTAILYHSTFHSDSAKIILKHLINENANRSKKTIHNTFREFKHKPAYSTWFGDKMPVDFDICVQANALLLVLNQKLAQDETDIETAHLIIEIVRKDYHLKYPQLISPHYQNTAVILYHLSRLISIHPELGFLGIKEKIIGDIQSHILKQNSPMEILLLENSLLMLGNKPLSSITIKDTDFQNFYFFVANMTSTTINPFKTWFSKCKSTNFYYKSEAYYWTLVFENVCLRLEQKR
ncbi:MAG: hypothetical protein H7329_10230 [Opitutaceae bacterium]|nr:hypothetical protein [Cytophagales bacterium]